jgi:FtsH-binding integral membrane protein
MSDTLISKILKVLTWLMMGVSVVLTVLFYSDNITEGPFLVWAYILFAIAALFALAFPVYFFISNPKKAIKALLGIGAMAIVLLIGYLLSDATPIVAAQNNPDFTDPKVLVWTDTGLIATYILFGVSFLLLLYTGARSAFRKK